MGIRQISSLSFETARLITKMILYLRTKLCDDFTTFLELVFFLNFIIIYRYHLITIKKIQIQNNNLCEKLGTKIANTDNLSRKEKISNTAVENRCPQKRPDLKMIPWLADL